MISVRVLTGAALEAALEDVAALRIAVFREWPYLYDGDLDYELGYLERYRTSPGAVLVGAFYGARLIGAATGTPMTDHAEEFAAPFGQVPVALDRIFYGAESVLLAIASLICAKIMPAPVGSRISPFARCCDRRITRCARRNRAAMSRSGGAGAMRRCRG